MVCPAQASCDMCSMTESAAKLSSPAWQPDRDWVCFQGSGSNLHLICRVLSLQMAFQKTFGIAVAVPFSLFAQKQVSKCIAHTKSTAGTSHAHFVAADPKKIGEDKQIGREQTEVEPRSDGWGTVILSELCGISSWQIDGAGSACIEHTCGRLVKEKNRWIA